MLVMLVMLVKGLSSQVRSCRCSGNCMCCEASSKSARFPKSMFSDGAQYSEPDPSCAIANLKRVSL